MESSHESRFFRVMGAFVMLCLVFAAGFALRGNETLLSRLGVDLVPSESAQNPGLTISGDTFDSLTARIAEVQGALEQRSMDDYDLEETTRALVDEFLAQTNDPYARYYDAQEYLAYRNKESGDMESIGVLFGDYQNQAYAVDVLSGSPAQSEGVAVGDFVEAIDGERRDKGWTVKEVLSRIDEHEGSSVVVTWRRPASIEQAGGDEFTTTLACGPIEQENVTYHLLEEESVGYIKIRQFGRTTAVAVANAIGALVEQGATSFVVDLRNCPGGYLTQAVEVAALFQESGVVVQIQSLGELASKSAAGKTLTTAPMAVIVNKSTAGAAEVFTASMKDNGRATIVGETTMGKGTVQMMYELSFGGAISYTVAEYLSPSGRSFDKTGVNPDLTVEASRGEDGEDVQLRLAIEAAAPETEADAEADAGAEA